MSGEDLDRRDAEWRIAVRRTTQDTPVWLCTMLGLYLPVVSLPVVLAVLVRTLRMHVRERLLGAALSAERFSSGHGLAIRRRLWKAHGRFGGLLVLLALYGLALAALACPFLIAASMPTFDFTEALEGVLEVEEVWCIRHCHCRGDWEALPRRWPVWTAYYDEREIPAEEELPTGLPVIEEQIGEARPYRDQRSWYRLHTGRWLPYEGLLRDHAGTWHHVQAVAVGYLWDGTRRLGIIFYSVSLTSIYLAGTLLHLLLWLRFARHRTGEIHAAALVRGEAPDPELLAGVKRSNRRLIVWMCVLAPLVGVAALILPFVGPILLNRHFAWEQRVGLDEALER